MKSPHSRAVELAERVGRLLSDGSTPIEVANHLHKEGIDIGPIQAALSANNISAYRVSGTLIVGFGDSTESVVQVSPATQVVRKFMTWAGFWV